MGWFLPLLNHGLVDCLSKGIDVRGVLIRKPALVLLQGTLAVQPTNLLVRVQGNQDMSNVDLRRKKKKKFLEEKERETSQKRKGI